MTPLHRPSGDIDWPSVHARLAQAALAMAERLKPPPGQAARILEQRARRLAKPLAAARPVGAMLEVLAFTIAGERYAIETRHVREVVRRCTLTPLPGVPEVAGIANLRGQILVVFDLRPLLRLTPQDAKDPWIVVCGNDEPDLGFVTDSIDEVVTVAADDLRTDPQRAGADTLVRGLSRDALIVLDGSALLADRRLCIDQSQRQSRRFQGE